jgi:DNA-binding protein H-NS
MSKHDDAKFGSVDLDGMTVEQLTALIAAAEAKRREKREGEVAALREEVERRAAALGISPDELFAKTERQSTAGKGNRTRKSRSDAGAKRTAKFRDPETGEEWSGRGRPPGWLTAQEAKGKDRKEFAVEPEPELELP